MTETAAIQPILIEIEAPVSAERAWHAVTDPAEVAEWFADVTPADGRNSPYRIDFGDGSAVEGRIRALEPGRKLAYTWTWTDDEDSPTTLVTWDVETIDGGARIRLTHDGWSEAGADAATRNDHAEYWQNYLDSLEELLTAEGE